MQGFANLCMFVIPWTYAPVASKLGALLLRQSRHDGAFHLMEFHKHAQWFVQSLHALIFITTIIIQLCSLFRPLRVEAALFVHTLIGVGAEVIPLGLQHDGESHIQKRCEGLHRSVFV